MFTSYSSAARPPPKPKTATPSNNNTNTANNSPLGNVKMCVKCNKSIFNGAIELEGKLYHSSCLVCKCGEKMKQEGQCPSQSGIVLQNQTDQTGSPLVDNAVQTAPELFPNLVWSADQLGGQTVLHQLVDGLAKNIALPKIFRTL